MSHEFESGMFVGQAAWHGLGVVLKDAPKTSEEAIKLAGLDWKVEKLPMFLQDGLQVPDAFAMVRDSDNSILGVTGNRYTPLQNSEAFEFFDPIIQSKIASYETAGSLFSGQRVWILAKLTGDIEVGKDDIVQKYVLLSNSHDGTSGVVAKVTPIRVVCNNTLTAALHTKNAKSGDEVKVRHTKSVVDRTKQASKLLETVNEAYDSLAQVWKGMVQLQMPPMMVSDYFQAVLPDPEKSENPHRTIKQRTEFHLLMKESSLGGTLDAADGTLWGAYNSVTAYTDHVISTRKDATADKHLESVWFGNRYKLKDRAMEVALDFMKKEGINLDV